MKDLHILGLQLDLHWEDPTANRKQIEQMLVEHGEPADIITLPEMFSTAYSMEVNGLAEEMMGPSMQWMRKLAQQQEALVVGSLSILEAGKYYNRFIAMDSYGIVAQYDKRHPFSIAGEHEVFEAGKERIVFDWQGWRICPQICYDLRFPTFARTQSDAQGPDYDLLFYVANWPKTRISHWSTLLRARAIENQAYVVGINRVGVDGKGFEYNGGSAILDPLGKPLTENFDNEIVLSATISAEQMQSYRKKFPIWQDADQVEISL